MDQNSEVAEDDGGFEHFVETITFDSSIEKISPSSTILPGKMHATAMLPSFDKTPTSENIRASMEAVLTDLPRIDVSRSEDADYLVMGELGRGGMGVVNLAMQRALGREVAIKRLHSAYPNAAAVEQMVREACTTGNLEHPSILPVHAFGADDQGIPHLVMKRIEGTTWTDVIDAPESSERFASLGAHERLIEHIDILIKVCQAMEFAHHRGVLHRDLKPDNVMLGDYGEVFVVDWGVAVSMEDGATDGSVVGTPHYMAPEMTNGEHAGPASDVFLLGACLHRALLGKPRHGGPTALAVLFHAYKCEPYDYPGDLPAELIAIMERAMARDPEDRYPGAAAFRAALEDYLEHRHAIELCEQAEARSAEVERALAAQDAQTRPGVEVRTALAEARFGFMQAARIWPASERAARGLRSCALATLEIELRHDNLHAARDLIDSLEEVPESMHERLVALEDRLAAKAERTRALEAFEREHSTSISSTQRGRLLIAASAFILLVIITGQILMWSGWEFGHRNWTLSAVAGAIVITVGALIFGRDIEWNTYNRKLAAGIALCTISIPGVRVIGWALGADLWHTMVFELFYSLILACFITISSNLKIWWAVGVYFVLAIIAFFTHTIFSLHPLGLLLLWFATGVRWARRDKAPHTSVG